MVHQCGALKWGLMYNFEVPVIGMFMKYDQFKQNIQMELENHGDPDGLESAAPERWFWEHYLCHLANGARFMQLESVFRE